MDKLGKQRHGTVGPERSESVFYLDFLRILSMLGVIFMHIASVPLRTGIGRSWMFFNVITSFSFTAVPVFFMISGALVLESGKTGSVGYLLKKRIPKLVIPLVVWSLFYLLPGDIIQQLISGSFDFSSYLKSVALIPSEVPAIHLWFVYTLVPLYLVSPFLKAMLDRLDKKSEAFLIVLSASVIVLKTLRSLISGGLQSYFNFDILNKLDIFGGYLSFFLIGYFLKKTERRFNNVLLLTTAAADLAFISSGTYFLSVRDAAYNQLFQTQSNGFIGLLAVCVFLFCKQNIKRPRSAFIQKSVSFSAPLSFGIYLMHNLVVAHLYEFGINIARWQGALVAVFITPFICILMVFALASVKPLCYPFTGMSYSEACRSCNLTYLFGILRGRKASPQPAEKGPRLGKR